MRKGEEARDEMVMYVNRQGRQGRGRDVVVRQGRGCRVGVRQGRGCMDQVFSLRQVCEKYLAIRNMYSELLWIWKSHIIRSIGIVCGRY